MGARGARLRAGLRGLVLGALLVAVGATRAQSIGYTVQVVAVSDRATALDLIADLDGFPAYFVRASTGVGDVYRVRVGAFANRAAAERYAAAVPPAGGSSPVPALAENIPTPLMPLQGGLLEAFEPAAVRWDVVAWGEAAALRRQDPGATAPGAWVVSDAGTSRRFDAWRAAPDGPHALLRVRDVPLWPERFDDLGEDARTAARASVVAQVAQVLGLDPATVDAAAAPDAAGVPRLIILERVRFDAVERVGRFGLAEVVGLADASKPLDPDGPTSWLAVRAAVPGPAPTRLPLDPDALVARGGVEVAGATWAGRPDGRFVELEAPVDDSENAPRVRWRAVVGTPLWASEDLLLVRDRAEVVLYQIRPR